jgi:hypothetical protein
MSYKILFLAPLLLLGTAQVLLGTAQAQFRQLPTAATTIKLRITPENAIAVATEATNRASSEPNVEAIRRDPAFRAGYNDGYRQGAGDSMANSNSYSDESGSEYQQATDGYNAQYGDIEKYRELFRRGYIAGYKAGWDFNAGRYCGTCGPR